MGINYRISRWHKSTLRSRGPAIDLLANKYNGGGHAKASGCSLKSFDDIPQFVKDAEEVILNYK